MKDLDSNEIILAFQNKPLSAFLKEYLIPTENFTRTNYVEIPNSKAHLSLRPSSSNKEINIRIGSWGTKNYSKRKLSYDEFEELKNQVGGFESALLSGEQISAISSTPSELLYETQGLLAGSSPIGEHQYLIDKKIQPDDSYLYGARLIIEDGKSRLIIPMENCLEQSSDKREVEAQFKFRSYQYIVSTSDGYGKFFPPSTRLKGGFFLLLPKGSSAKDFNHFLVAEGFATAASVHIATALPVVVAFSSTNIRAAIESFWVGYGKQFMTICSDYDYKNRENPGYDAALKAATLDPNKIKVVFPTFAKGGYLTDFNDLHVSEGVRAVQVQVLPPKQDLVASPNTSLLELHIEPIELLEDDKKGFVLPIDIEIAEGFLGVMRGFVYRLNQGPDKKAILIAWVGTHWVIDMMGKQSIKYMLMLKLREYTYRKLRITQEDSILSKFIDCLPVVDEQVIGIQDRVCFRDGTLYRERDAQGEFSLRFDANFHKTDFIFSQLDYGYAEKYEKPKRFMEWMCEAFENNIQMIELVQEIFGACLFPCFGKIFLFYGEGGTGKSTLVQVIQHMLGEDNFGSVDLCKLGERFSLTGLVGKHINIVSEIDTQKRVPNNILKDITENAPFTIEYKGQTAFKACLPSIHILCGNDRMNLSNESDKTMQRRVVLIEMKHSFLAEDNSIKTAHFSEILVRESKMIFGWALVGLRRLMERGDYFIPEPSKEDLTDFVEQSNIYEAFLSDIRSGEIPQIAIAEGETIKRSTLGREFMLWAEKNDRYSSNIYGKTRFFRFLEKDKKYKLGRDADKNDIFKGFRYNSKY